MKKWIETHKKAQQWAETHYPAASKYHVAAFSNSVAYLVTGASGGSGPSIREHLCSWALSGDGYQVETESNIGRVTVQFPDGRITPAGEWEDTAAYAFCAPICFGPLPELAKRVLSLEHCFDDDPNDLIELKK